MTQERKTKTAAILGMLLAFIGSMSMAFTVSLSLISLSFFIMASICWVYIAIQVKDLLYLKFSMSFMFAAVIICILCA